MFENSDLKVAKTNISFTKLVSFIFYALVLSPVSINITNLSHPNSIFKSLASF